MESPLGHRIRMLARRWGVTVEEAREQLQLAGYARWGVTVEEAREHKDSADDGPEVEAIKHLKEKGLI